MALKTTLQQLEDVQAAISAAERGQSYTVDGLTVTRGNLAALYARETMLLDRYRRETGGGSCTNTAIPRRN